MPERILFVSHTADRTGPTNSLLLLLNHLRDRYDVAVLLPQKGLFSDDLVAEDIPFFSFSDLRKWSIPSVFHLIRSKRFALVYGNTTHGSSRNALIAAKLARIPFICHIREMGWNKSWRKIGFLKFVDGAVAVSNACGASIAAFAPRDRIHVVYNGVASSRTRLDRESARAHLLEQAGLTDDNLVIVSVANLSPRKGQLYAVETMAAIVKKERSAHLLLVGDLNRSGGSDYVDEVRARIRELNLNAHVTMLGFRRDVQCLLQGADIFMHTATADPHPRAVIEAMSVGLPVVALAVDGVAETVASGETGYLVPADDVQQMADATLKLVTNKLLRDQMGRSGYLRARSHFSSDATAEQVATVIDSHLRPPGHSRGISRRMWKPAEQSERKDTD